MDTGQLLAFVGSVGAAVIVGVFSYLGVRQNMRSRERSEIRDRAAEAERFLRRYRDPVARTAFDLQSRLYNIVNHDFLGKYLVRGTPNEQEYALQSTLYVTGEFLGWVEIMRRMNQFLDLGDVARNRQLSERLAQIASILLSERPDSTFRVFRAEQRAIGESMLTNEPGDLECIGYAAFVAREADPAFAHWFEKLATDVHRVASEPGLHDGRIRDLQRALIDLLDFLDPDFQYFHERQRGRLAAATTSVREDHQPAPEPVPQPGG